MSKHNLVLSKCIYEVFDRFCCSICGLLVDKRKPQYMNDYKFDYVCYLPKCDINQVDMNQYDHYFEQICLSCEEVILMNILC